MAETSGGTAVLENPQQTGKPEQQNTSDIATGGLTDAEVNKTFAEISEQLQNESSHGILTRLAGIGGKIKSFIRPPKEQPAPPAPESQEETKAETTEAEPTAVTVSPEETPQEETPTKGETAQAAEQPNEHKVSDEVTAREAVVGQAALAAAERQTREKARAERIENRRKDIEAKRATRNKESLAATRRERMVAAFKDAPEVVKNAIIENIGNMTMLEKTGIVSRERAAALLIRAANGDGVGIAVPADLIHAVDEVLASDKPEAQGNRRERTKAFAERVKTSAKGEISEQTTYRATVLEDMSKAFDSGGYDALKSTFGEKAAEAFQDYRTASATFIDEVGSGGLAVTDALADQCAAHGIEITTKNINRIVGMLEQFREAPGETIEEKIENAKLKKDARLFADPALLAATAGARKGAVVASVLLVGTSLPTAVATGAGVGAVMARARARRTARGELILALAEKQRGLSYGTTAEAQAAVDSGDAQISKAYVRREGQKAGAIGAAGGVGGGLAAYGVSSLIRAGLGHLGFGPRPKTTLAPEAGKGERPVSPEAARMQPVSYVGAEHAPPVPQKLDVNKFFVDHDINTFSPSGHHEFAFDTSHQLGMGARVITGEQGQHVIQLIQHGGKANSFVFEVKDPQTGHFRNIAVMGTRDAQGNLSLNLDPTSSAELDLFGGGKVKQNELVAAIADTKQLKNLAPTGNYDLTAKAQHSLFSGVKTVNSAEIHGKEPKITFTASLGGIEHQMKTGTVTVESAVPVSSAGQAGAPDGLLGQQGVPAAGTIEAQKYVNLQNQYTKILQSHSGIRDYIICGASFN